MSIVAGVAVDKGERCRYRITIELVDISGGRETKTNSKIITMEGNSIFDAARNEILKSGRKLYFSHTKVLIISQELAREGVTRIIDWFNRDTETRGDILILISQEETAAKIFNSGKAIQDVISFDLDRMIRNQRSLSKAPITHSWQFLNDMISNGISASTPAVHLDRKNNEYIPNILGTAIFKNDKFVCFLNGEDTKTLLFVRNKIKGGILEEKISSTNTDITLEIFSNKTRVKSEIQDKKLMINITTDTIVAIDEVQGSADLLDETLIKKIQELTENDIKQRIENLIKKSKYEVNTDFLGFGLSIANDMPEVWKEIGENWNTEYKNLEFNIRPKVTIKNSANLPQSIPHGD